MMIADLIITGLTMECLLYTVTVERQTLSVLSANLQHVVVVFLCNRLIRMG